MGDKSPKNKKKKKTEKKAIALISSSIETTNKPN